MNHGEGLYRYYWRREGNFRIYSVVYVNALPKSTWHFKKDLLKIEV